MNEKKYNFDLPQDRTNTHSLKWNYMDDIIPKDITINDDAILPFWVADMDFRAPEELIAAMHRVAEVGIYGYENVPTSHADIAAKWMNDKHNWNMDATSIMFSAGVVYSVLSTILATTEPGDEVLLFHPIYYPLHQSIIQHNRVPLVYELQCEGNEIQFDLDEIKKLISNKTKLCILCNPHNPSGRLWRREELVELGSLLIEHNIIICSNDIHSDLHYSDYQYIPLASIDEELARHTVTCLSPSKTFNLGGMKIAHCSISNPVLHANISKMHDHIWGHHPFTNFGIAAYEAVYTQGHQWYGEVMEYLESNRNFALSFIDKHIPQIRTIVPHATYLLWLDFRTISKDETDIVSLLLEKAKVCLSNGKYFGNAGEGYMRLNFACPQAMLQEGLQRIQSAINQ